MNFKGVLVFWSVFLLINTLGFAYIVIEAGIDKFSYLPSENITASGEVFNGTLLAGDVEINITTLNSTGGVVSSTLASTTDGVFSTTIPAPSEIGSYSLAITFENTTVTIPFIVSNLKYVNLFLLSTGDLNNAPSNESIIVVNLSSNSAGFSTPEEINASKYGNFSYENETATYYVVAGSISGEINLFIKRGSKDLTAQDFKYLKIGSKIVLANTTYTILYIHPEGDEVVLGRLITPKFYGTESEYAKLLAIALDADYKPINNISLTTRYFDENGNKDYAMKNNFTSNVFTMSTNPYGIANRTIYINPTGGFHNLVVNGFAHVSYYVEKFVLRAGIETEEGMPIIVTEPNTMTVLKASAVDISTNELITNISISATITKPDGTSVVKTLVSDSSGIFVGNYTPNSIGDYTVKFDAVYGNNIQSATLKFKVQQISLFMHAFSPEEERKGMGQGFSPNSEGALMIGGKYIVNGSRIDLAGMTNNCQDIIIAGMYNSKGEDKFNSSSQASYNLSGFWQAIGQEPPEFVKQEIQREFGEGGCGIIFTSPGESDAYKIKVVANISGSSIEIYSYLSVQDVFIWSQPVNEFGIWKESVSPGGKVFIRIDVFDPVNGAQVQPDKILDAKITEVYAEGYGVVTDKISNESFTSISGGKALSFYASDNKLGHHFVRFLVKANVTRDGSERTITAIGEGWFREELYRIYAWPMCEGFGWCAFGSNSTIQIQVQAFDASGANPKGGIVVSLDSIKNSETGKIVSASSTGCTTRDVNTTSSNVTVGNVTYYTGSTITGGDCILNITPPSSGWSSGGHEVVLVATDQDDNEVEIRTRFDVRNFEFWAWTKTWEIASSQNIEIEVNVKEFGEFGKSNLTANISVEDLLYMGSHDNWIVPRPVREFDPSVIPSAVIAGQGIYIINSSLLPSLTEGQYELVLKAVSTKGTQITRTGFYIRPFVAWIGTLGDNPENAYEIGGNMTVLIKGYESVDWWNWTPEGPDGTPHNITNATITKIIKSGEWGKVYKYGSNLTQSASCLGNKCNLTVNLTGFGQSQYEAVINVFDANGQRVEVRYWFKTETYKITIPELHSWKTISTNNRMSDVYEYTFNTYHACGGANDDVKEPAGVTSCLYDESQFFAAPGEDWNSGRYKTYLLLDKTGDGTLYVNAYPEMSVINVNENKIFDVSGGDCDLNVTINSVNATGKTINWTLSQICTNFMENQRILSVNDSTSYNVFTLLSVNEASATFRYNINNENVTVNVGESIARDIPQEISQQCNQVNLTLHSTGSNNANISLTATCTWPVEVGTIHSMNEWEFGWSNFRLVDVSDSSATLEWTPGRKDFTRTGAQGTQVIAINETFTDAAGYRWNLTNINTGSGKITLKLLNGVIRSTSYYDSATGNTTVNYENAFIVNKSISKSGIFLYGEKFWDDEWMNIDLDGDGNYGCNYNNETMTWKCEEYYLLMADSQSAGVYDTILLSSTRNMSAGIVAGAGQQINLTAEATPIYLLKIRYNEVGGVGNYQLVFTSNKAGWTGMSLGVYPTGSVVKIPVLVTSPSNRTKGIEGLTVTIEKLISFGGFGYGTSYSEYNVTVENQTTNSKGFAMLELNASKNNITNGEYSIQIKVCSESGCVTPGNEWEYPRFELRSFELESMLGIKGTVTNVTKWSMNEGNLQVNKSTETILGSATFGLNCGQLINGVNYEDLCRVQRWELRQLWINKTSMSIMIDNTPDNSNDWNFTNYSLSDVVPIEISEGMIINVAIQNISLGDNFSVAVGENATHYGTDECSFVIVLHSVNIQENSTTWTLIRACPSYSYEIESQQKHYITESSFGWGNFNISSVSESGATFNWITPTITLGNVLNDAINDIQSKDNRVRILNIGNDLQLVVYNSLQYNTTDDIEGHDGVLDTVVVVNTSTTPPPRLWSGTLGQPIPYLNNWSVVRAEKWSNDIYFSNLNTSSGEVVYPLPWYCDQPIFYFGEFTEQDINTKVEECWEAGTNLTNRPYYIILFDDMCDGILQINKAKIDDDPDMWDRWVSMPGTWNSIPYDYLTQEKGRREMCYWGEDIRNYSEHWIDVGKEGWPFSVSDFNESSIDIFKRKDWISSTDNVTKLTLWVKVKDFEGRPINGTINLTKATCSIWICGKQQKVEQNITSFANVTEGIGYLEFDVSNATCAELTLRFKVQDSSVATRYEIVDRQVWYEPARQRQDEMRMQMEQEQGCGFVYKGPEMPTTGPGMPNETEMPRCEDMNDRTMCEDASAKGAPCVWNEVDKGCRLKPCSEFNYSKGCPEFCYADEIAERCVDIVCEDFNKTLCNEYAFFGCSWNNETQNCTKIKFVDCFNFFTEEKCLEHNETCEWVTDPWGGKFCERKCPTGEMLNKMNMICINCYGNEGNRSLCPIFAPPYDECARCLMWSGMGPGGPSGEIPPISEWIYMESLVPPTPISPGNGETLGNVSSLEWEPSIDESTYGNESFGYQVNLTLPNLSSVLFPYDIKHYFDIDGTSIDFNEQLGGPLSQPGSYSWSVRSVLVQPTGFYYGNWSDTWNFTIS
ncbi:MAG: hypothetical protein QXQ40_02190 [Candidatus Aenigmatarchaeota archaeon]